MFVVCVFAALCCEIIYIYIYISYIDIYILAVAQFIKANQIILDMFQAIYLYFVSKITLKS